MSQQTCGDINNQDSGIQAVQLVIPDLHANAEQISKSTIIIHLDIHWLDIDKLITKQYERTSIVLYTRKQLMNSNEIQYLYCSPCKTNQS